ncbi:MAG: glyoxalase [Anaerorhabdus sp.]|uniref:glyoxalase n=2 Tax=Anaerorhabdus sp. TaxID=1872524 RepID=UPI002B20F479|nr:glyoxalase [Anaerorhabdus sp.]MEA4873814.1 glyoxalase [Anaerorhabdus sp.]
MINKVRIMIYGDDIDKLSEFWIFNFNAEVIETIDLPGGYINKVIALSPTLELSLFNKEFIKKYSPEVLDAVPSLMLYTNEFDELHNRIKTASDTMEIDGIPTFNFSDPEGNYFVVTKQQHDKGLDY